MLKGKTPGILVALAALVAGATLLPVAYLLLRTAEAGPAVWELLFRRGTWVILRNTIVLAAAVTMTSVAIALPLAWLTTRTQLPGRRLWVVLAPLPLAVPSYVMAYTLIAALGPRGMLQRALQAPLGIERLPEIYGFPGSLAALALVTYPYVYLGIRAALQRLDPSLSETARLLGHSQPAVFRQVVLPLLRPAIYSGALLAALYTISDFGAVALLRYDTFTRAIFLQYQTSFDRTIAAAFASVLVLLTGIILVAELGLRGRSAYYRIGAGAARPAPLLPLGAWKWPALAFCALIALLSLALPMGVVSYWLVLAYRSGEVLRMSWLPAWNSLSAAALAAVACLLAALPVSILVVRYPRKLTTALERLAYAGNALPGVVVALALVFFGIRLARPLYQTLAMLIFAYVILFLPQAVGAVQASLRQVNPHLEEAGRTLGLSPLEVLVRVTLPLVRPGLLAALSLVFLSTMKELAATLLLSPVGFKSLATVIWQASEEALYARAAPPMALLLLISGLTLGLVLQRTERG